MFSDREPCRKSTLCGFVFQYPFRLNWLRRLAEEDHLELEVPAHLQGQVEWFYCTYSFPRIEFNDPEQNYREALTSELDYGRDLPVTACL